MNDYELIAMNIQEKVDMGELTIEEANYLNDRAYEMYTEKLTDKFYKPIIKYKEIQKDCKELDEELKKHDKERKKAIEEFNKKSKEIEDTIEKQHDKMKKDREKLEKKLKRKKIIKKAIIGSAAVGATAGLLYASNKDTKKKNIKDTTNRSSSSTKNTFNDNYKKINNNSSQLDKGMEKTNKTNIDFKEKASKKNISNNTTNNTRSTSYINPKDWYNDFEKEKENYYKKISEINKKYDKKIDAINTKKFSALLDNGTSDEKFDEEIKKMNAERMKEIKKLGEEFKNGRTIK